MDQYVVAGHPVEHSQSPFIHALFAQQTGEALHYGRLLCPLDGFEASIQAFARGSAAGPARGCNVTVPFKFEAFRLCTERTERAALAGAANTLRFDPRAGAATTPTAPVWCAISSKAPALHSPAIVCW